MFYLVRSFLYGYWAYNSVCFSNFCIQLSQCLRYISYICSLKIWYDFELSIFHLQIFMHNSSGTFYHIFGSFRMTSFDLDQWDDWFRKVRKYDCWNYHRGNSPKTIDRQHRRNSHSKTTVMFFKRKNRLKYNIRDYNITDRPAHHACCRLRVAG